MKKNILYRIPKSKYYIKNTYTARFKNVIISATCEQISYFSKEYGRLSQILNNISSYI